jgi:hypothetical protein
MGLVLKGQVLAGNPLDLILKGPVLAKKLVAGSGSEKSSIGWYPVADLVLRGQLLAGNPLAGSDSER